MVTSEEFSVYTQWNKLIEYIQYKKSFGAAPICSKFSGILTGYGGWQNK